MERACGHGGRCLVEGDDNSVVTCRERIVDIGLNRLLPQGGSLISEDEGTGIDSLVTGTHQVIVRANSHHLIVGVERLRLKRVIGHKALFLACKAHLASSLENVGREGGVPQADLVDNTHKLAVIQVAPIDRACATRAHNHAVAGRRPDVRHADGQCTLAVHIHGSVAIAKDVKSHMVPSLILERRGRCSEGIVRRGELQHTAGVHPQLHLARLHQLGLALLPVGAHPEFDGAVVGGER